MCVCTGLILECCLPGKSNILIRGSFFVQLQRYGCCDVLYNYNGGATVLMIHVHANGYCEQSWPKYLVIYTFL